MTEHPRPDFPSITDHAAPRPVRVAGWIWLCAAILAFPLAHLSVVERPMTHFAGSWTTALFAGALALGSIMVSLEEPEQSSVHHRVGTWLLRISALLGAGLGVASFLLGRGVVFLDVASVPVTTIWLFFSCAHAGRCATKRGNQRIAKALDLLTIALPLLWIGAQLARPSAQISVLTWCVCSGVIGLICLLMATTTRDWPLTEKTA